MPRRLLTILVSIGAVAALTSLPAPGLAAANAGRPAALGPAPFAALTPAGLRVSAPTRARATTWTSLPDMRVAVSETGGGAFINKRLYVPGGYRDYTTLDLFDRMQIHNTALGTWSVDPEVMPAVPLTGGIGWAQAAVCTDGAKVYVIGGTNGSYIYNVAQVYDPGQPVGSRWSFGTAPVIGGTHGLATQNSGCAWIGGKLYLFGGYGVVTPSTQPHILRITWVYDPVADAWSDTGKPIQGTPTLWFGYTSSKFKAFFAGGTADIDTRIPSPLAEVFSPSTGWSVMPNLPVPGGATQAGLLGPGLGMLGTHVEVIGGGGYNNIGGNFILQHATLECVPGCTGWTDAGRDLNTARWFQAYAYRAAAGGGAPTLYVAGGGDTPGHIIASAESTT